MGVCVCVCGGGWGIGGWGENVGSGWLEGRLRKAV